MTSTSVETEFTRVGTCFCGASRVVTSGIPIAVSICHCSICRTLSGAPLTAQALFKADRVKFEGDEPTTTSTSPQVNRCRCARCSSPMYASLMKGTMMAVPLSLINTPGSSDNLKPTHHMYYGRRVLDVDDDLQKFVKSKGELWTPECDVAANQSA